MDKKNAVLGFFAPHRHPRLRYVMADVLADYWSIDLIWFDNWPDFEAFKGAKCHYTNRPLTAEGLWIKAESALLNPQGMAIAAAAWAVRPPSMPQMQIETDVLALIFFHLSRLEEYEVLPQNLDKHGRFPAAQSVLHKAHLLEEPIVNQWIIHLEDNLKSCYPFFQTAEKSFTFQPTYDIDQAWAVRHKGFWRSTGSLLKLLARGAYAAAWKRGQILRGGLPDPEFTFPYLDTLHDGAIPTPIFFWLLGDYSTFDKNISVHNPTFQALIKACSARYEMGLHPSYASNTRPHQLAKEVQRFRQLTPQAHHFSLKTRQHYLKLTWPHTYRALLEVGVQHDFTLGYADAVGFRAGMASPFYWYDLEAETTTTLRLHPFQVMDVTLKDYLKQTPEQAQATLQRLIAATKAVNGCFTSLWHNSSLSDVGDWKGWRKVYEFLLKYYQSTH